jgi:hypothetical protein
LCLHFVCSSQTLCLNSHTNPMITLTELWRAVPPEVLIYLLLVLLTGMVWLILAIRRRLRPESTSDGWCQLEELAQDLRQRKQD